MNPRAVILFVSVWLILVSSVKAQDTIDTNYYRYAIPKVSSPYPNPRGCPNGVGFTNYDPGDGSLSNTYMWNDNFYYVFCKMRERDFDVYGIALLLDRTDKFVEGDSIVAALFDGSCFLSGYECSDPIGSIVLKGWEVGKRRWMEIPIMQDSSIYGTPGYNVFCMTAHDDCIDHVEYLPIMEFYFDTPRHVPADTICYTVRPYRDNGSSYCLAQVWSLYTSSLCIWYPRNGGYSQTITHGKWHHAFPITAPLPDWEVSMLDTLIPMPHNPEDTVSGEPEDPENIGEAAVSPMFSVYPNPAMSTVTVEGETQIRGLSLSSVTGATVIVDKGGGTSVSLDVSALQPGIYVLKITTIRGLVVKKIAIRQGM